MLKGFFMMKKKVKSSVNLPVEPLNPVSISCRLLAEEFKQT